MCKNYSMMRLTLPLLSLIFGLLLIESCDGTRSKATDSPTSQTYLTKQTNLEEKTTYPKKANSLKKRLLKPSFKKLADITDKFRHLPENDLAFIKELDKQFKLYGGRVKIRVENVNQTASNKNNKRTIESDLGYGHNGHMGYDYGGPKYMFYPYSQNDIPPSAPGYYLSNHKGSSVSIEPSYSYKLKTETYIEQRDPAPLPHDHGHGPSSTIFDEPIIVLRIPGPAKYAAHLKDLLQQYLEIRAAQYLNILEETEHQKHQQQQQHQQQHYQPPLQYVHYGTPSQMPEYTDFDNGYHMSPPAVGPVNDYYQYPIAGDNSPDYYNDGNQQQGHGYAPVYLVASGGHGTTVASDFTLNNGHHTQVHQSVQVHEQHQHGNEHSMLPISENYPADSHTKVIFTQNPKQVNNDQLQKFVLPSIKPNERYPPTSVPTYHQDFQPHTLQVNYQMAHNYIMPNGFHHSPAAATILITGHHATELPKNDLISITQRPYNYHAHMVKKQTHSVHKRLTSGPTAPKMKKIIVRTTKKP